VRRRLLIIGGFAGSLLAFGLASRVTPAGYTRIDLTENDKGRNILSAVVRDGERVTLTWRHSQFGLHVVEVFIARNGVLVQDQVTFSVPGGLPPQRVSRDVGDLYHAREHSTLAGSTSVPPDLCRIGGQRSEVRCKRTVTGQTACWRPVDPTATRPALHEILWLRSPPCARAKNKRVTGELYFPVRGAKTSA
jgi:hypothetical protein